MRKADGYRDALVDYARTPQGNAVTITFRISRGARYVTDAATITGNSAVTTAEILEALRVKPGTPFVEEMVTEGLGAVRNTYRSRGFTRVEVAAEPSVLPGEPGSGDRRVALVIRVNDGARTRGCRVS